MEDTNALLKHMLSDSQLSNMRGFYLGRRVLVTGGASFIGSNLVDMLLDLGARVKVVDDLSSGALSNLSQLEKIEFVQGDLRNLEFARKHIRSSDTVFHLAAIHGGRGFIEKYKQEMLANLAIDNNVFSSAVENGVENLVHASSACAYPTDLQSDEKSRNLLSEDQASMEVPGHAFADGVYGWTKLIGEYQLENHCSENGMRGRSARIFTAYGERENESHAAIALISKAILKADPYPIWGNGEQTRNFTHVVDTALGLLFLGSDLTGSCFDVYNIGTSDHVKVIDFVKEIFEQIEWQPSEINFQLDKPTGVAARAADNEKILNRFGWCPSLGISEGLARTIAWYRDLPNRPQTLNELEERLESR